MSAASIGDDASSIGARARIRKSDRDPRRANWRPVDPLPELAGRSCPAAPPVSLSGTQPALATGTMTSVAAGISASTLASIHSRAWFEFQRRVAGRWPSGRTSVAVPVPPLAHSGCRSVASSISDAIQSRVRPGEAATFQAARDRHGSGRSRPASGSRRRDTAAAPATATPWPAAGGVPAAAAGASPLRSPATSASVSAR
jgi:hypothetical protein